MGNLKEFMMRNTELKKLNGPSEGAGQSELARISAGVSAAVFKGLAGGLLIPASKAEQFSDLVAQEVTGDAFTSKLSDELGLPHANETEDEFVVRAKAIFSRLASSRLK